MFRMGVAAIPEWRPVAGRERLRQPLIDGAKFDPSEVAADPVRGARPRDALHRGRGAQRKFDPHDQFVSSAVGLAYGIGSGAP